MFAKTLPGIYEILGDRYCLSSKCLYASTKPHSIIVLEDLSTLGFQMLPRQEGCDMEHCFKVIEKMANLHAASVIMHENDASSMKPYEEGLFVNKKIIRDWVATGYAALIDACNRWPGFEKYSLKLKALEDKAIEGGFKTGKRRREEFSVLNHGDLWINNMMFSYDRNKKLKDLRFVDPSQMFASILLYVLATSTKVRANFDFINVILDYYYAQLLTSLTKLNCSLDKAPTREQFLNDFNSRASYGLMASATVLPLVKASSRKDFIHDCSAEGFRYHTFNNKRYRTHMEYLLPYYDGFGILD